MSQLVTRYKDVIYALIMHDIKNRFFGNGLGQLVMIVWPAVHIAVILTIYLVMGRVIPFGKSPIIYCISGVMPFIVWSYASRWIVFAALQNKPFLNYPIIRPLDIFLARSALELVGSIAMTGLVLLVVAFLGADVMPVSPIDAFCGFLVSYLMAFGFGLTFGALCMLTPFVGMMYTVLIIIAYASSGILFVASNIPEKYRYILSFNPILQLVEWMRSAYYPDYPLYVIDKGYTLAVALSLITSGFVLINIFEKYFKR